MIDTLATVIFSLIAVILVLVIIGMAFAPVMGDPDKDARRKHRAQKEYRKVTNNRANFHGSRGWKDYH